MSANHLRGQNCSCSLWRLRTTSDSAADNLCDLSGVTVVLFFPTAIGPQFLSQRTSPLPSTSANMPVKGATTRLNPIRLQTIPHLRIRRPNQHEQNPCVTVMSSMLSCWASAGYTAEGCAVLEQQLRQCMDAPSNKKNTINYHLTRMYPKVVGPKKKNSTIG
ncbi:hypothetical protein FE257_012350 [Aspergillus nanangensis]|uniref:37S ribosomal protein mrp10, mitochondrial n=1 Tax=Aspergillus nanangensis TaxID=2582783 RepID=A0AAD4CH89_ASPNN|nr:hypothetical protein FE257_012350 [Aspergillus nanangensis]